MLIVSYLELTLNLSPCRVESHSESIASLWVNLVDQVWYAVMCDLVFFERVSVTILTNRVHFGTILDNMAQVIFLSFQNLTTTKYTRSLVNKTLLSVVVDFIYLQGSHFAFFPRTLDKSRVEKLLVYFRYFFCRFKLPWTMVHGALLVRFEGVFETKAA